MFLLQSCLIFSHFTFIMSKFNIIDFFFLSSMNYTAGTLKSKERQGKKSGRQL